MPEQQTGAGAGATGLQQEMMSHDYTQQFSVNSATQAYSAQGQGQAGGLAHFQYHPQVPPMAGAGPQQHHGDELYNDPSKMGQMGAYGQLETFGGIAGADVSKGGGYGGGGHQYSGKGYGKGNVGAPQQGGASGMMQGGWQQQQQQQNMMNQTWTPNNMNNMYGNPYMNPNFNMLYMQQAAAGYGMYPMGGGFQSMPNAQSGLGGNTGGGAGGGGGGGKSMHQKVRIKHSFVSPLSQHIDSRHYVSFVHVQTVATFLARCFAVNMLAV